MKSAATCVVCAAFLRGQGEVANPNKLPDEAVTWPTTWTYPSINSTASTSGQP